MRIVAQRGQQLLVRLGGSGLEARGRIYDLGRQRLFDEMPLATLEAAGYWGPVELSDSDRRKASDAIRADLPTA